MKKILFLAIVTLTLVGCSGGRSKAGDATGASGTSNDPLLVTCGDHAQLVSDKCACVTGYEMDSQGTCVAIVKVDLAAPVLKALTLSLPGGISSKDAGKLLFNASKDVDGAAAPSAEIHYVYKQLTGTVKPSCAKYADAVDCQSTLYDAANPPALTVVGTYCVKAVACDNGSGKYTESQVMDTVEQPVKVQ